MAPTVLGTVASTRTQRVLLVLEELGIKNAQDTDYVRDHHPFAKIPVFQDDGVEIFESRAIARYLAVKHKSPLAPPTDDPDALATFEQLASVEYAYFEPAISSLGFELIFKELLKLGETDEASVEKQKVLLTITLDYYNRILGNQDYLAGKVCVL
ncbi:hypothetical protein ACHAPJ_013135 [Fusarium lateritium]